MTFYYTLVNECDSNETFNGVFVNLCPTINRSLAYPAAVGNEDELAGVH